MKKKIAIISLILTCVVLAGAVAGAVSFNFTFTNLTSETDTRTTKLKATSSSWGVFINSNSNLSSLNVFGMRPRRVTGSTSSTPVGSYKTFTENNKARSFSYSSPKPVKDNEIFGRGKKDNTSISGTPLNAIGDFTP